jgi:MoaA/NifB/PqqE/SkfB family radical SAM enzyme
MDREVFSNIVKNLQEFPVTLITPYWVGESMLHPEFDEMITELFAENKENRLFRHLNLNTNAALMDEVVTEQLLNSATGDFAEDTFVRIHFSLDAIIPSTYRSIKGAANLATTNQNVEYFLTEYAKRNLQFPKFNIAIIVMPENRNEVREFVRHWQNICDKHQIPVVLTYDWPEGVENGIYIRRLDTDQNQAGAEELHKQVSQELGLIDQVVKEERIIQTNAVLKESGIDHNQGRRPCAGPFKTPIIHWSGQVTVCCFDVKLQLVMGSLENQTLKEIWTGEKIHALRMAHIRGEFCNYQACSGCTNLNTPLLPDEEIIAYLRQSGESESLWTKQQD